MKNALLHVDADEPSLQLYKLCVLHGWTYHKVDTATELYNIDLDARIILCESDRKSVV